MSDKDFNIFILFPDEEIEKIVNEIRGYRYNPIKGIWEEVEEPLMTERGLNNFKLILKSILNPNTFMTNIKTEREAKHLAREFLYNIMKELMKNKDFYQLRNEQISMIMTIIIPYVVLALKRPLEQGEREFHKTTTVTRRDVMSTAKDQQETIPVNEFNKII